MSETAEETLAPAVEETGEEIETEIEQPDPYAVNEEETKLLQKIVSSTACGCI